MKLNDLLRAARSYRSFEAGATMSGELLLSFVENARIASATMNLQPLKYRLVTDMYELRALTAHTRWAASLSISLPPEDMGPAAYIVVCHDTAVTPDKEIFLKDVGICSELILLSAAEAGFGGCILGSFDADVHSILGLDESLVIKSVVALGKPSEKVVLEDSEDGRVKYYRDAQNIHHVPKRKLEDIIIK